MSLQGASEDNGLAGANGTLESLEQGKDWKSAAHGVGKAGLTGLHGGRRGDAHESRWYLESYRWEGW